MDMCTAHWKQQGTLEITCTRPAAQYSSTSLLPAQQLRQYCCCSNLDMHTFPAAATTCLSTTHAKLTSSILSAAALRAAVNLGVMDAPGMSDSAVPISQLAAHTSASQEHLYRLLRYLAQFGIFEELPEQHFKLTSMGQYLRADHPSGLCYASMAFGAAGHYMPWMHLDRAVKEGV
jgi:hypothetical protein